jgi:hypothetical protein
VAGDASSAASSRRVAETRDVRSLLERMLVQR